MSSNREKIEQYMEELDKGESRKVDREAKLMAVALALVADSIEFAVSYLIKQWGKR